jgi:hypothetical protein
MTFCDYLLHLFYLIDTELEALGLPRLRERGPRPTLADSEVIAMELAGEFRGIDTDEGIFDFFRTYHRAEFPALARVDRTTFTRQAANLWRVERLLQARLLGRMPVAPGQAVWVLDSFPLHVCRFARARYSKCFAGQADYGRDPVIANTFYGFRVHLRHLRGAAVAQVELAPARASDLAVSHELAPPGGGLGVGDRNYWGPMDAQELRSARGFVLLAPFRSKARDPHPAASRALLRARRLVETVTGQLAERFHAKRTWARDLWHLCHRLIRKVLSHTAAVLLNIQQGNPPLQLAKLVDHG